MRTSIAVGGLALLVACSGRVNGPAARNPDEPRGGAGGGGGSAGEGARPVESMPSPLQPTDLDSACTKDAAHPRRLLRLAPAELIRTLKATLSIDDASVPPSLASSPIRIADDTLVVSPDFLDDVDRVAASAGDKLASNPGKALTCGADRFGVDVGCTDAFVKTLVGTMFRGRGDADDVAELTSLARSVAQRSGGKTALAFVTRAAVLSPKVLYLSEGVDGTAGRAAPLTGPELAAFLSYRIDGGPPSDALLAAAASTSVTVDGVRKLLEQQFGSERLATATATFLGDWLDTHEIPTLKRDAAKHPEADAAYLRRLADETDTALAGLAHRSDLDLTRLLTGDSSSPLLKDDASRLATTIGRPGVFTLPGVIAGISSGDHTNIPRRGRLVLQNLFCQQSQKPPPNALNMQPMLRAGASERERFELVEMQPSCGVCHKSINHLAFGLESYDEMGAMRTQDEHGNAIDTAATFTPAAGGALSYKDVRDLMTQASKSQQVEGCVAIHAFRQAARRQERGDADACLVRDLARDARSTGYHIGDLVRDALARAASADRAD